MLYDPCHSPTRFAELLNMQEGRTGKTYYPRDFIRTDEKKTLNETHNIQSCALVC